MHTIIAALERSRQFTTVAGEDDIYAAALRSEIDVALVEARRLAGSNRRPTYSAIDVHARIRRAVIAAGSCTAWGRQIGVGKSYAYEVYAALRPPSDRVLAAIGLVKKAERYTEI